PVGAFDLSHVVRERRKSAQRKAERPRLSRRFVELERTLEGSAGFEVGETDAGRERSAERKLDRRFEEVAIAAFGMSRQQLERLPEVCHRFLVRESHLGRFTGATKRRDRLDKSSGRHRVTADEL